MKSIQRHEIRLAAARDRDEVWRMIEPVIRASEVYTLPANMSREEALASWFAPTHSVFVAESGGRVVGTYYLRANQAGGDDHVANCGYATSIEARGQGVASTMSLDSLQRAREHFTWLAANIARFPQLRYT